jgi:16S rRNA (adenine1518-N6/adenine1519-N6)-dimethyltransferase
MGKFKRPPRQKDTLRDLNVRPTKERGQNFLINPEVPRSIVEFANFPSDAKVVEIGPGTGALTECLSAF